jgi:hypothetical protein
MTHEDFREFTDPANNVSKLLQSHLVALQLIMAPIWKNESPGREQATTSESSPSRTTVCWLVALHSNIPQHMRKYYDWPIFIENEVRQGRLVS